jgi:hypothetical protein
MKDIDAQLMMEAYNDKALLNELGALPLLAYSLLKAPVATKTVITTLSPLAGAVSAGASGLGAINGALASIATVLAAGTSFVITSGVVIAALLGTKALIKYLENARARKKLDNRIVDIDSRVNPEQEILPPEAIKPA